ncbi:MAG: M20/M25/M40 family metallo-hydrolase [Acidobacteria bacterium]|nr:M20/M25/M40 family metallo-hydrolase [Acidobacteriota bacterium]
MRRFAAAILISVFATPSAGTRAQAPSADASLSWLDEYREPAARLIREALSGSAAWNRLAELTDTFGPRLAGSENLDRAIEWAVAEMKEDGLDAVRAEPVMVPRWVRGRESLEIVAPVRSPLVLLGLGNSAGTPAEGVQGEVLVVRSWGDLDARAADVKGRIVLFNVPYTNYGETVQYRARGASRAARHGAIATLLRSVGPTGLRTPHTGGLQYADDAPKIPAAAIPSEDADRLQRMRDRGTKVIVRLTMEAKFLPDAPSANVVGERRGRERPEEIVVVGCHLDSWDVGTGATDDGGGCIAAWEAVRMMKTLGLRPRRTVRVVLFTNEENGLRGGLGYRDRHRDDLANHVLMIESDGGVFRPTGFGFTGSERARAVVERIAGLLKDIDATDIRPGGGGADIGPSVEAGKIPAMSLNVAGNYFLIHHTPADTIERIAPEDIAKSAAAMAVMAYVVADMPERLSPVR